jgi:prophage regulatory protein
MRVQSVFIKGIQMNQTSTTFNQSNKLIRIRGVLELTGISKSYAYYLSKQGLFPQSVSLISGGSAVAWVESEILDWVDSRIKARDEELNNND